MNILNGNRSKPSNGLYKFHNSWRFGFTLIEILIAMAVSAFILVSLYTMFDGVVKNKEGLEKASDNLVVIQSLERMIARDLRMMTVGTPQLPPPESTETRLMSFVSQDSLRFNKSIPVEILYFTDNDTLYRRERKPEMNYEMTLRLLPGVKDFKIESFDGTEYRENFLNGRYIYKFTFMLNDKQVQFITGRLMDTTNE